jgi:hypothetical protein
VTQNRFSRKHAIDITIAFAILLCVVLLIAPLFRIEYFDNWGSIDSTFIADARFLMEHWPHPLWQPLWYCGTRFDYIYPPAIRYGSAIAAMAMDVSAARAYHLYTGAIYCLGVAGVYAFVRLVGNSRVWSAIAAAAVAVLSPSFLFLTIFRHDSPLHIPQRLNVLIKYGEGPHISSLSLLPIALLFAWRALSRSAPTSTVFAAVFCALVVAHNFYGATALAIFFSLVVWSLWVTQRDSHLFIRAITIALLAYGLSAFWLTPSYLGITASNLKLVAEPGNVWSRAIAIAVALSFAAASWWLVRKHRVRAYTIFISGAALCFSCIVIGHYYLGFRVVGEPHRFVPELDLVLILGGVEGLRWLSNHGKPWTRVLAAVIVIGAFATAGQYVNHPWSVFIPDMNFRSRIEYRLSDWLSKNMPGARIFVTGSLRFWYNVWHDGAQVGGGSDQGITNQILALAQTQVTSDDKTWRDMPWLKAMGADAIFVPGPESEVIYHEYKAPAKFDRALPIIYNDGKGDVIYKVPRKYSSHARIVRTTEFENLAPIPYSHYLIEQLNEYVKNVEEGPDGEVDMRREAPETIVLRASLIEGESLVVQESYDPAWRAYCQGRPVPIRKDAAGFMQVLVPPGVQEVRLVFETPLENLVGQILTGISASIALVMIVRTIARPSPARVKAS